MNRDMIDVVYRESVDIAMEALECHARIPVALERLEAHLSCILNAGNNEKADCVRRLIERLTTARWTP